MQKRKISPPYVLNIADWLKSTPIEPIVAVYGPGIPDYIELQVKQ